MPELPDIVVYIESLEARVLGRTLKQVRLLNPFILRTAVPPISAAEGKKVAGLRRLGKRIVFEMEGGLFLVIHLMIAGRLRWSDTKAKPKLPGRIALALFEFDSGTLVLTEAGTKRMASLAEARGRGNRGTLRRNPLNPERMDRSSEKAGSR
jgi:formamidopyrimidine-DNA glycosylase